MMSTVGYVNVGGFRLPVTVSCEECGRVFDLRLVADSEEWHYGHDCEV